MKRSLFTSISLLLVGLFIFATTLSSVDSTCHGAEKIEIGSLMALTGGLAPYGPPIKDGSALAIKHINEAGGVLGKELELVIKDTQSERGPARDAASKLVNLTGVPAIIGALSSGSTIGVSTVTSSKDVVLISPSATSALVRNVQDNDYTFRTVLGDRFQSFVLARLAGNLGYKNINIIYVNNPYGKGLATFFKDYFEEKGGKVNAMVPYKVGLPSYGGEASKLVNPTPDAILTIGYPTGGNKLLQKIIELGYEGSYLFTDGMKGEGVQPGPACPTEGKPSEQYIEGSFGTAPSVPGAAESFEKDYNAAYGASAVPFKAQAYDATVVIALAMQYAGEASGSAIKDNLRTVANAPGVEVGYGELEKALKLAKEGKDINWQGVSGPIEFDKRGDVQAGTISVWGVQDCEVKSVWFIPTSRILELMKE